MNMNFLKDMAVALISEKYIEGKQNIDELIADINEVFEMQDKQGVRKTYEEKISYKTSRIDTLGEILRLKKFKKNKNDALKIYKIYLKEVSELGKLFEE